MILLPDQTIRIGLKRPAFAQRNISVLQLRSASETNDIWSRSNHSIRSGTSITPKVISCYLAEAFKTGDSKLTLRAIQNVAHA